MLSEALVRAGAEASQKIVEELTRWSVFQIAPFDTRAAIEVAAMTRVAKSTGQKKGSSTATWAKVKFDRQIVAIAKVAGATMIYSDDEDIQTIGGEARIPVKGLADLPLPPENPEPELNLPIPKGELFAEDEPPIDPEAG